MATKITAGNVVSKMLKDHGLSLYDSDMYIVKGIVYISTAKAAELLSTTHHQFCVSYVRPLLASGVRRVILGRRRYYCLSELLMRLEKSIEKSKSIYEICELMEIKSKKKKKK